jgi:excisionase family DNA binding protein
MWQRFTERARNIIFFAQEEATRVGENYVGTEHILLGLIREKDCLAAKILTRLDVSLYAIRAEVESRMSQGEGTIGKEMQLTPKSKRVIDMAYEEARQLNNVYIGTEHLLLGVLRVDDGMAAQVLTKLGADLARVRQELLAMQDLLDLEAAVQFLGTSKPTLYRLLRAGDIKGVKVGRQWRFRRTDLEAYLEHGPAGERGSPTLDLDHALALIEGELLRAGAARPEVTDGAAATREEKERRLVDSILAVALRMGASDLHVEPVWNGPGAYLLIRVRLGGLLQEIGRLPMSLREPLTHRLKLLAGMDPAQTAVPQEGSFTRRYDEADYLLRVSSLPTLFGEVLALRIESQEQPLLNLDEAELAPEVRARLRSWLRRPDGLVLATGPWAYRLLAGALAEVVSASRKTLLIQRDGGPRLPNASPVLIHERGALTYAAALRACFPQAADLVLVDALPDRETAAVAHELALAGRLVLAAAQGGSTAGALQWLLDQEIEPRPMARALVGVITHVLVPRICPHCKQTVRFSADDATFERIRELASAVGVPLPEDAVFYEGAGCDPCRRTGFQGDVSLFEVMPNQPEHPALAEAILRRAPAAELTGAAPGIHTLLADGLHKALEGQATLDAVLRATGVML